MGPNDFSILHLHVDPPQHAYRSGLHATTNDERGSISSSDDGNYLSYHDVVKYEGDGEDDPNPLTSQTLNTDGTPKRPMNAFMIFARRRRPQVSAENQAMRTGEISKILSKEWNAMPPIEKQFYQEQARQLKDTFNSRYPDYVYRRRPNHSRRPRRKNEAGDAQNSSSTSEEFGLDDSSESPSESRDQKGMDHISTSHAAKDQTDIANYPFSNSRADYTYSTTQSSYQAIDTSTKPFSLASLKSGSSTNTSVSAGPPLSSQSRSSSHAMYSSDSSSSSWDIPPMRPSSWMGEDTNRSFPSTGTSKTQHFDGGWPRPPSSMSTTSTSSYGLSPIGNSVLGNEAVHDPVSPQSTTMPPSYGSNGMSNSFYGSRQYDSHDHSLMHTHTSTTSATGHYQNGSTRDISPYLASRSASQELPSISNYSLQAISHPVTNHLHGNWTRD